MCASNCMAVTASITGLKVYDPTREAGECASLCGSQQGATTMFLGSEI